MDKILVSKDLRQSVQADDVDPCMSWRRGLFPKQGFHHLYHYKNFYFGDIITALKWKNNL